MKILTVHKTKDRAVHTIEQIGKTQHLTKEGYLLCVGVPIARTGTLLYGKDETPVEVGRDGIVKIERHEDEVFKASALASFEGKPVDHPNEDVGPDNFKEHTVGVAQNIRRGEGIDDDLMIADFLIQDKDAIEAVRDGLLEVSCGYDADYEQFEPGRGRQLNIMGNHVALVKNGRCGSRCSIQDRSTVMSKKNKVLDALHRAFKAKDAAELEKIAKDMEGGEDEGGSTHVHVHLPGEGKSASTAAAEDDKELPENKKDDESTEDDEEGGDMKACLGRIEALLTQLVGGDETEDDMEEGMESEENMDAELEEKEDDTPKKTKDTAARLEILVPGTKVPVRDAKADPKKFRDAVCACKRKALDGAFKGDHQEVLKPLLSGIDLKKASRATVDALFVSASEMVKVKNNAAGSRSKAASSTNDSTKALSVTDINKKNREVWATRGVQ